MRPTFAYTVSTPDVRTKNLSWSGDPEKIFASLQAMGYDGVELFVRDPLELDPEYFRTLLARTGLKAAVVGTGPIAAEDGLCLSHPDPAVRKKALARGKAAADFASELGSLMNVGKFRGDTGGEAQRKEWAFEGLRELAAYALQKNVPVMIEPQNRFGCDACTSTKEGLAWLDALASPNISLMLDVFHMQIDDACLPASFIEAAPHLSHVHFADTRRDRPGTGGIDFALILRVLQALRYTRFISVEIKQTPDSETAARNALEYLRALCAAIWP